MLRPGIERVRLTAVDSSGHARAAVMTDVAPPPLASVPATQVAGQSILDRGQSTKPVELTCATTRSTSCTTFAFSDGSSSRPLLGVVGSPGQRTEKRTMRSITQTDRGKGNHREIVQPATQHPDARVSPASLALGVHCDARARQWR